MKLSLIVILMSFFISCTKKDDKSPPQENVLREVVGNPVEMRIHDPSCDSTGVVEYGSYDVALWNGKERSFIPYTPLILGQNQGGIFSQHIQKVEHGLRLEEDKNGDFRFTQGKRLYICEKSFRYPLLTVEQMSLVILSSLDKGLSRAKEWFPRQLDPFEVYVNTYLVRKEREKIGDQTYREIEHYKVDNASWSLLQSQRSKQLTKAIFVFPMSEKWQKRELPPLWSMPQTILHELGHHVFSSYFPELFEQEIESSFLEEESSDKIRILSMKDILISRSINKKGGQALYRFFEALNEGVSDLFAYAVQETDKDYDGVFYFENNRQVTSAFFTNSQEKVLKEKWYSFYESSPRYDGENSLTDEHFIGAIFAHILYSLWTYERPELREEKTVKLGEILGHWMSLLVEDEQTEDEDAEKKQGNQKDDYPLLNSIFRLAFIAGKKFDIPEEHMCSVLNEKFLFLDERYFRPCF